LPEIEKFEWKRGLVNFTERESSHGRGKSRNTLVDPSASAGVRAFFFCRKEKDLSGE